jgi:hypothetical protein
MCLWNIKKQRKPNQDVTLAYKILYFNKSTNSIGRSCFQGFAFTPGVWYANKAENYWNKPMMLGTEKEYSKKYLSGFHVFKTKQAAEKALKHFQTGGSWGRESWRVAPVLVKDVRTEGIDGACGSKYYRTQLRPYCLVAQQILVIPEK